MKRLLHIFFAAAVILGFSAVSASAQATFTTRKEKLSDLMYKTTKVVLTGNDVLDETFREEVISRWRITPYEFCTLEEFATLKNSKDYYFLMIVQGQFHGETAPGINLMTMVKGGSAPAGESTVNDLYEVVSFPIGSAVMSSGRELVFMPAFIDIVQQMVTSAVEHGSRGDATLKVLSLKQLKNNGMTVLLSEDDLAEDALSFKGKELGPNVRVVPEDEADEAFARGEEGVAAGFVIAPLEPQKGSLCYRMLIGASDHRLYFFEKGKISEKSPRGFRKGDVGKIVSALK